MELEVGVFFFFWCKCLRVVIMKQKIKEDGKVKVGHGACNVVREESHDYTFLFFGLPNWINFW